MLPCNTILCLPLKKTIHPEIPFNDLNLYGPESCERSQGPRRHRATYKNMPLYHFVEDKNPGDTLGQGVKDAWYVADP